MGRRGSGCSSFLSLLLLQWPPVGAFADFGDDFPSDYTYNWQHVANHYKGDL